jgi:hypothetical protein
MPDFRATNKQTGQVIAYVEPVAQPAHLSDPWILEEVADAYVAPADPEAPVDTRMFGGRRRLTKLEFVALLGSDFTSILAAAKSSVEVEVFVMLVTLATPNPDGTSIDLDDPRMQALHQLEIAGVLGVGRAAEILNG